MTARFRILRSGLGVVTAGFLCAGCQPSATTVENPSGNALSAQAAKPTALTR